MPYRGSHMYGVPSYLGMLMLYLADHACSANFIGNGVPLPGPLFQHVYLHLSAVPNRSWWGMSYQKNPNNLRGGVTRPKVNNPHHPHTVRLRYTAGA